MKILRLLLLVCLAAASAAATPRAQSARAAENNYVIGAKDVLVITVFDQTSLSGRYVVDADGTFTFPHLGPVKAGGLTVRQFEDALRKRLGETLFRNPQVTVGVETYRSQRIFIMGEVRTTGPQPLTGAMTLIEAIAQAGGPTPAASGEAVIVRPKDGSTATALLPGQDGTADVIRVDLQELQSGRLKQNVQLRDGDTLYVPRAETIYIFGEVRNPGAYAIQRQMTVIQALSLAGGQTPNGAMNRIQISRVVNGKEVKIKVKNPMIEIVKAGDTLIVPERWF